MKAIFSNHNIFPHLWVRFWRHKGCPGDCEFVIWGLLIRKVKTTMGILTYLRHAEITGRPGWEKRNRFYYE